MELGSMRVVPKEMGIEIPDSLGQLLKDYYTVFEKPYELPPTRIQDHAITLKPRAVSVSVRPYCYPYVHKNEIEKLVQEMRIIQPSHNPFSSLILLFKKDGSWHCVDYRALNKVTVPDCFSVPIIDELLDELSSIF